MEMLTKNIVMSGCCCQKNDDGSNTAENTTQTAGAYLNNEIINTVGLARAYVPVQPFSTPMEPMTSLSCGSVFGPLVMPYVKGSALDRYEKEECGNE